MLLRISLFVAVLATAGALFFSFQVKGKLATVTGERDTAQANEQNARTAESAAKASEKKALAEAEHARTELTTVAEREKAASTLAAQQKQRADRLQTDLERTTQERNQAQQGLAAYEATGVRAEQIKNLKTEWDKAAAARDALIEEKQIFSRHIGQLETKLKKYENPDQEVKMPAALTGKVIAVDPRYDFVVFDAGSSQGAAKDGKVAISRNGRLVAKAKIINVEANRSVANILPDTKQSEVLEGDSIQAAYEALARP